MTGRTVAGALGAAGFLIAGAASVASAATPTHVNWPTFGWNSTRSSAPDVSMGINAKNIDALQRQQIKIGGTVDSSPIYLHGVTVKGSVHDAFFVTTTYGKTLAIDADDGAVLWKFTPSDYSKLAGSYRITTATPVAGPDGKYLYAAAPDGMIRKLTVADGQVVWSTAITKLPRREKIASPLSYADGHVIAVTGGYIGDTPPYQGHVAILDPKSGAVLHIWNSLCSARHELMNPRSCKATDSAIWGRAGAVIDPANGDIFIATGNGPWNGKDNWGDSVIELNSDATKILGNYTPQDTHHLNEDDLDLGSSSPVLTGGRYIVQGGKDGYLRVLDWQRLRGAKAHKHRASFRVSTPGGAKLFTAPAIWRSGSTTWLYVADKAGTAAWTLAGGKLRRQWHNDHGGTSPVVADGLVFVYDPGGGLRVYDAKNGRQLAKLPCGSGHWNSPIVVDGRIALPQGNANSHRTSGVLNIWREH